MIRWLLWWVPGLLATVVAGVKADGADEMEALLVPDIYPLESAPGRYQLTIRPFGSFGELSLASKDDPEADPPFAPSALGESGWRFREGFALIQNVGAGPLLLDYEVRPDTAALLERAVLKVGVPWQETKRIRVGASLMRFEAKVLFIFAAVWSVAWGVVLGWKSRRQVLTK